MWRFFVNLFAILGFLGVLAAVGIGVIVWRITAEGLESQPPAANTVLELDLRFEVPAGPTDDPVAGWFGEEQASLEDIVQAIDRAAADHRIVALSAHLGGDAFSFTAAQELRDAVLRWRQAGKPALAYSDGFGEFSPGNFSYYLASAFDEIWMRPMGSVGLTGLRVEVPFARDALDALEIDAEFSRHGPYKTFPDVFTDRAFSPAYREMMTSLVRDLYGQLVAGIADGRGLSPSQVRDLIDRGPLLADEAAQAGLLDALDTQEAYRAAIETRLGDTTLLDAADYLSRTHDELPPPAARVALIHAVGLIAQGDSEDTPGIGVAILGADTIAKAIDDAAADNDIDAILLRVDSGGGGAVASALIGAAVERAVDGGKPVVVSMGDAAGSGGYWIATHATAIVANPATLTGSIGVFGGKFSTAGLWDDLGIHWGAVQQGRNADIWSALVPYSDTGRERLDAAIDDIYARFVARVADGRGLEPSSVEAIAEGRVWTGAQAVGLGLVDTLGGLHAALATIRSDLFLADDAAIELVPLPRQPSPLEALMSLLHGDPVIGAHVELPAALREVADQLGPLLAGSSYPALTMPPMAIAR